MITKNDPFCDNQFNPDYLSEEELENICPICDGSGQIMLNENGQTREAACDKYSWSYYYCEPCKSCFGTGKHLGMEE